MRPTCPLATSPSMNQPQPVLMIATYRKNNVYSILHQHCNTTLLQQCLAITLKTPLMALQMNNIDVSIYSCLLNSSGNNWKPYPDNSKDRYWFSHDCTEMLCASERYKKESSVSIHNVDYHEYHKQKTSSKQDFRNLVANSLDLVHGKQRSGLLYEDEKPQLQPVVLPNSNVPISAPVLMYWVSKQARNDTISMPCTKRYQYNTLLHKQVNVLSIHPRPTTLPYSP
jgi:hypothetical protein